MCRESGIRYWRRRISRDSAAYWFAGFRRMMNA
jgi:hypothetical protein